MGRIRRIKTGDIMSILFVCRGAPGSGKSTLAKKIYNGYIKNGFTAIICSTDDFFMVDGEYKFDFTKLGHNHKQNFLKANDAIINNIKAVIIDNTNTTTKEVKPYVEVAIEADYIVTFIEPETEWAFDLDELVKRNTHNVPRESIQKMLDRWEETDIMVEKLAEELGCDYDLVSMSLFKESE